MRLAIAATAVVPLLGACALNPWAERAPVAAMPGQLEPIHAAAFTRDLAVFWVTSNGCTDKDDVTPVVNRRGGQAVITLRRLEDDRCERPLRDGLELKWTFEELGLEPGAVVSVNNPLQLPRT